MNKNKFFIITMITVAIALGIAGLSGAITRASAPTDWSGSWQMGPNIDTSVLNCTAGDGLARFTGKYYPSHDRVYFLGGRCETDTITTGVVFYFDPVTETFATTGATMPVAVSNYQVVMIDDDGRGHGPGLYIVGGRTISGGQTNAVQVYYPDDNLAEQIATDPFPPAAPYSPGGVAAQGGKIYVFGGFSGTAMFDTLYIYDPAAAAGSRWTLSSCLLPSARSYIATTTVGTKIYALGGDEWDGSGLVPSSNTVVLDTSNLPACWQDAAIAEMPEANGDAPAVYVDGGPIGGGIFVIGGYWPSPGPYRWVFRYDIAADLWETFPSLAIPDPATGRRNQAAVYIPGTSGGSGDGIPGIWAFGGYDGSGTNAQTETSEFFANTWLLPNQNEVTGYPGDTVAGGFTIYNPLAATETFDLSFTSDVTWNASLPPEVGPIDPGAMDTFTMTIDLPSDAVCGDTGLFTVTATAQSDPGVTRDASFTARVLCGVSGIVTNADTGFPIENAFVSISDDPGLANIFYEAYTDANGYYLVPDVLPGHYYAYASAVHYQPSFYPDGWPVGALEFDLTDAPIVLDASLKGSSIQLDHESFDIILPPGTTTNQTLTLDNPGSGPYHYIISLLDDETVQPPSGNLAIPSLPRVDPQIFEDIDATEARTTDFVVVLNSQANVDAAYGISSWDARGEAVYDLLTSHAEATQTGLRNFLDSRGVNYTPLYIINGVIVHSGDARLVTELAGRQDVAQLVANHKIAVEKQSGIEKLLQLVTVPETVEWNIDRVNAPDVWALGYQGQGVVVAEIDTGTQYDHPALINQYRGNLGSGTFDHNYNWYDPYAQCPDNGKIPCDPGSHGTHVMGTIVGDDGSANQIGVAPGAQWISCKGGDAVSGYLLTNELLVCAQWIIAPFDLDGLNPDPSKRPNVVNNSWGGSPNDYWYGGVVSAWRAAGIFPAFANGNEGPNCSTAHSPGDNYFSFGVGATDNGDNIASFSSRGPAQYTGYLKPQISAPGAGIRSSVPTNGYSIFNGTSMATPHVTGAVALLLDAAPELVGQVDLSAWVLEQSAMPKLTTQGCGGDLPTDVPNNTFGYGLLDTLAAVNLALAGNLSPDWLTVSPQRGTVEPDTVTEVTLTFTAPLIEGPYHATLWLVGDDPYRPDIRIPITMHVGVRTFFLPFVTK